MKLTIAIIASAVLFAAVLLIIILRQQNSDVSSPGVNNAGSPIRYLALGDSYTIGESVKEDERWPNQLTERLKADGLGISIVGNPSVTGYTTQNLIDRELKLLETTNPNFVTVLVGVNDYVQGVSFATFQSNFKKIIDAIEVKVDKKHILIVTIPDYAKTPAGSQFGDVDAASQNIKSFNDFMVQEAKSRGIVSVDVYPVSQNVTQDKTLVASDGLHPSALQYKLWTDLVYDALRDAETFSILKNK